MGKKPRSPAAPSSPTPSGEEPDLPERWSAQRKMELVLRLLRGEPLDAVSRESQVPAHTLEGWQRRLLDAGIKGLRSHREPEEQELVLARCIISIISGWEGSGSTTGVQRRWARAVPEDMAGCPAQGWLLGDFRVWGSRRNDTGEKFD